MARFPPVPTEHRNALIRLADFDERQFSDLLTRLKSTKPTIDRDEFVRNVVGVPGIPDLDIQGALDGLMYLSAFMPPPADTSIESMVSDIVDALQSDGLDPEKSASFRTRLQLLLALDTVALRAKALELQVDHARALQSARILTDVRPVFAIDEPLRISGLLVVHTLKIGYFQDQEYRELFIALDATDITTLREALIRAELKGEAIRSQLVTALGLTDFGTLDEGRTDPSTGN